MGTSGEAANEEAYIQEMQIDWRDTPLEERACFAAQPLVWEKGSDATHAYCFQCKEVLEMAEIQEGICRWHPDISNLPIL